ncbi:hypothetical protein PV325_007797 [Microctonus aethiopoides]|nr:hypothetical protein PV325_007797 [Microctonus aethiopoides]
MDQRQDDHTVQHVTRGKNQTVHRTQRTRRPYAVTIPPAATKPCRHNNTKRFLQDAVAQQAADSNLNSHDLSAETPCSIDLMKRTNKLTQQVSVMASRRSRVRSSERTQLRSRSAKRLKMIKVDIGSDLSIFSQKQLKTISTSVGYQLSVANGSLIQIYGCSTVILDLG